MEAPGTEVASWINPLGELLGLAGLGVVSCWRGFAFGGSHRISRETPFTQILVHSERRAHRTERRRAHRVAGERIEPARVLFGHDEPLSQGHAGSGENRRGRRILRGQGEGYL